MTAESPPGGAAPHELRRGEYLVSSDRGLVDLGVVHGFLTRSYWSPGISAEEVACSIEHSLPFGLYRGGRQVGFARVVTDYVKLAYVADVFVLEEARGEGLGKLLVEAVLSHPRLQGVWRWLLVTQDAHGLYRRFGFAELDRPERYMERGGGRPPAG
ncbi:MAG TPA: GNAT family N-acetyltransferase [Longimicrobiaceae bacterium]|nr:GNAT family N-acetyltransferase [Longimicrobiaceae bacterium]